MIDQSTSTQPASNETNLSEETRKRIALEEQLKNLSKPITIPRRVRWIFAVIVAVLAILGAIIAAKDDRDTGYGILGGTGAIVAYAAFGYGVTRTTRSMLRRRLERRLATRITTEKSAELQEKLDENFFTNLVKINFKYIDRYYLQTELQADKSFLLCAIAAVISLIVILAGIVVMLLAQPDGKIAGYVATAAGTLGEFIAAVFFYLYNQTITKMGEYHQKLVLTQNVSLALKISEELPPAEQVIARTKLIDYLSKDINLFLTARPTEPEQSKRPMTLAAQK